MRNLEIHKLDHTEWGSTYHKHNDQSEHYLNELHDSLSGDIDVVTAK